LLKLNFIDFAYEEKESIHTKINPITFVVNHHADSNSSSIEKNYLTNSSIIQICLVLFTIVSIIILAVLTGFYIHRTSRISQLEKDLEITRNLVIYEQIKNNQTIKTNTILNNTINDLEKERSKTKESNSHNLMHLLLFQIVHLRELVLNSAVQEVVHSMIRLEAISPVLIIFEVLLVEPVFIIQIGINFFIHLMNLIILSKAQFMVLVQKMTFPNVFFLLKMKRLSKFKFYA
jgi:hypothetical protein